MKNLVLASTNLHHGKLGQFCNLHYFLATVVREFKNGEFHGQGTFTSSEGDKYLGEFKDEKFWNGTTYEIDGNIFGNWVNGKLIKQ